VSLTPYPRGNSGLILLRRDFNLARILRSPAAGNPNIYPNDHISDHVTDQLAARAAASEDIPADFGPAPLPDHWTPTVVQMGALFVTIFQVAYLLHDYAAAPPQAFYLHLGNIAIALSGFVSSFFPLGQVNVRVISFWGLTALMTSMLGISLLTGDNDWFYVSIALLIMGASALMPWEIGWQTLLNLVALATAALHWALIPDPSPILHLLLVALAVGVAQTATTLGQDYRRQVEEARIDALAASKAKSEFLSSMSHEIRTPMNAVLGMADLLLDTETSVEQRRYLEVMIANGNSLLELINGILDLARIESGRLQIEKSEFDLTELVDNTISTFGVGAHTKGLELIARIAPGVPDRLVGDPLRLRQVLINLIGNAVKFTEHGEILLEISHDAEVAEPGSLRFAVADTGVGIAAGKLGSIFASFTQADSSTTRQYGGTGLGLAIAKRLVGLMGGKIWVESALNEGSRFFFTARFGVAARVISPSSQVVMNLAGQRVLVVDDNHINRLIVREMISNCGAEVTEAESGVQALTALQQAAQACQPFKIILLDMRMPEMDGLEVARRIRQEKLPSNPLILMLSSEDFKPQLPRLRELGLDAYLVKPITRKGLFESINRVLNDANLNSPRPLRRRAPAKPRVKPAPVVVSRLLVADDSPDNRLLIAAYLRREPYQVDFAEHGREAFEKFTSNHYDLVFMDVQMPEMDGLSATRMIRQWEIDRGRPPTPIVALSASALEEDVRRATDAGCNLHVSKPVKKRMMLDTIRNVAFLRSPETGASPAEATSLDAVATSLGEAGVIESSRSLHAIR
jgi:two-component system sensor histidine kinase/response regulator